MVEQSPGSGFFVFNRGPYRAGDIAQVTKAQGKGMIPWDGASEPCAVTRGGVFFQKEAAPRLPWECDLSPRRDGFIYVSFNEAGLVVLRRTVDAHLRGIRSSSYSSTVSPEEVGFPAGAIVGRTDMGWAAYRLGDKSVRGAFQRSLSSEAREFILTANVCVVHQNDGFHVSASDVSECPDAVLRELFSLVRREGEILSVRPKSGGDIVLPDSLSLAHYREMVDGAVSVHDVSGARLVAEGKFRKGTGLSVIHPAFIHARLGDTFGKHNIYGDGTQVVIDESTPSLASRTKSLNIFFVHPLCLISLDTIIDAYGSLPAGTTFALHRHQSEHLVVGHPTEDMMRLSSAKSRYQIPSWFSNSTVFLNDRGISLPYVAPAALNSLTPLAAPKGLSTRKRNAAIKAVFGNTIFHTLPGASSMTDFQIQAAIDVHASRTDGSLVPVQLVADALAEMCAPLCPDSSRYCDVAGAKPTVDPFDDTMLVPANLLVLSDHMEAVAAAVKAIIDTSMTAGAFVTIWKLLRTPDFEAAALGGLMD